MFILTLNYELFIWKPLIVYNYYYYNYLLICVINIINLELDLRILPVINAKPNK